MPWLRSIAVIAAALVAAYLLGSIPFGYIVVKIARGVDLTRMGSGHTGGTNVLRSAGPLAAAITVIGDMAKGYLAAYLARELVPAHPWVAALAGLIVILGHNHSLFLGFKGGVGTMTTAGAALALLPLGMLVSMVIGAAVLFGSRYASLGSITFAVLLPIACLIGALVGLWPAAYLLFALGSSAISLHALRANIARLRLGTERKIGQSIPQGRRDVR